MKLLESLIEALCCPDDAGRLKLAESAIECQSCGRTFPVEGNMVSMVSKEPASLVDGTLYAQSYEQVRDAVVGPGPWGLPERPRRVIEHKRRYVAKVRELLLGLGGPRDVVCDFSAGPGYYTLPYAREWQAVLHCDISGQALKMAQAKAAEQGLDNILFVRMDYLRPPFRQSLGAVFCVDSLIRGLAHELALLAAIRGSLRPNGSAIVDFHNWWHNPLRRLGILHDQMRHNRSYSRRELGRLLADAGISDYQCFPFHQEANPASPLAGLITWSLPPSRWMYRIGDAATADSGRS